MVERNELWDIIGKELSYEEEAAYEEFFMREKTYTKKDIWNFISIGFDLYLVIFPMERFVYNNRDKSVYILDSIMFSPMEKERQRELDFGWRLDNLMIHKHIAGDELARRINVTPKMITNYRRGRIIPSFYKIQKICDTLICDMSYFTIH